MQEVEKGVNPQLWHACTGGMIQMPLPNSYVYYFPQGHAEHTLSKVDFSKIGRVPDFVLCRVIDVKFLADLETDEVYAKIRLVPLRNDNVCYNVDVEDRVDSSEKPTCFAKTLSQSDANLGGGFSVPRYCANNIYPRLDYSADLPVQTITVKDVHGEVWKFRHVYSGTARRNLLTTGWSTFVNQKKLVAGDSVVFVRTDNEELCVGIRRVKRGDSSVRGKVGPEDVIEATSLAANGQPFEVTFDPHASTADFCVKASCLTASLSSHWCAGMRFKMPFETEDLSRVWFIGTVSSVGAIDPFHWPNSPWRLLQVRWDKPNRLQNVERVSPWLVEPLSYTPPIQYSQPLSPQTKKLQLPQPPALPQVDNSVLPPENSDKAFLLFGQLINVDQQSSSDNNADIGSRVSQDACNQGDQRKRDKDLQTSELELDCSNQTC